MSYRGRIIGAIIGLLLFRHPVGMLIGFLVGLYFDKGYAGLRKGNASNTREHIQDIRALFMPFLFTSLGHLAKSDGRISEAEISHAEDVMKHYGFDVGMREEAIRWFQDGAKKDSRYEELLQEFAAAIRDKPDVKKVVLELLVSLAMADGIIHPREEALLLKIAVTLGVHERMFQLLLNQLKGQQAFGKADSNHELAEACRVLGVNESDSMDVIKKAYRKLMSEHHPDKLIAQGVPEAAIRMATEKSQVIQSAYEIVKKHKT